MTKFRGIIYKTTCLKTSKSYIGQQRKINGETINEYLGSGELLLEAIKQYGRENFIKTILIDRFFKNKEELNKLETEYIVKEKTLYPNGYNQTLRCWPPDLAACSKGGKIGGKNTWKNNREHMIEVASEGGKNTQEKWAKENPELAHKYAVARGKIGGKIGGKNTWKNNRERMIEVSSKGGKIGGKNVWKNNRKRMIEVQSKRGKIGVEVCRKKRVNCFFDKKLQSKGGKNHAHVIFEIDGIYQQMTLGRMEKL